MFPNGDGTQPPDPITVAQPDVLASVAEMYTQVQSSSRLSAFDRQKLDQHQQLIRDMESRLRFLANLDCSAPTIEDYYWGEVPHPQRFDAHTQSFWDLATVGMSCGITRVVTMQWGQLPVEMIGGTGDLHHDYAHVSDPNNMADPAWPNAANVMTNFTAKYAEYIAALADQLDAIPEATGGTLLDNTMILFVSEISHGGHDHDRWPVVIVGGGNRLRSGLYLNYERDTLTTTTASWVDDDTRIGLPHQHLLVAIAQAMGLTTNVIGDATVRPKKTSAPDIDLSGPLPGLLR
jgi:hypothetical protein